MAHQIAGGDRQGGILRGIDLFIAFASGFGINLGVYITRSAGHVARAHRFATGGFHGFIDIACCGALRHIALVGGLIVVATMQRQRIRGAAGHQHLITAHPSADLRQPHCIARQARGIDRITDR